MPLPLQLQAATAEVRAGKLVDKWKEIVQKEAGSKKAAAVPPPAQPPAKRAKAGDVSLAAALQESEMFRPTPLGEPFIWLETSVLFFDSGSGSTLRPSIPSPQCLRSGTAVVC